MPGSTRSMQLEHVLRNAQTDRGSLLHGRPLRWQFDTVTLAHRMPSGGVHPITRLSRSRRVLRTAGVGQKDAFPPHLPNAGYVIGKETVAWASGVGELRRFRTFPASARFDPSPEI